jgi:VanZ family protein
MQPFLRNWLAPILWALLIFYFSTDGFSSSSTSRYICPIIHWLVPGLAPEYDPLINHLVRKLAHLSEYFVLGVLVYRGFLHEEGIGGGSRIAWLTLIIIFVYACGDEYHQLSVPSRSADFNDSLIDFIGGSCGVLCTYFYHLRVKNNVPSQILQ